MKNIKFSLALLLVAILSFAATAQSPWQLQRATGLPNSVNPAVTFSAVDENICWGINTNNSQYIRTTDGGTNWTVSTITGATGSIGASVTAIDANNAWVAMNGGIFKTTDGGLTWAKQLTSLPADVIHFFDSNNGVCVADPSSGYWAIYTTTNGGTNWTRVPSANIPPPLSGETGISGNEDRSRSVVGNSFWFSTFSGSLYRTADRGTTWTVSRNVTGNTDGFGFAFKDSLNGLACTFVGSNRLTRTSNGGASWSPILPLPSGLSGISAYYIAYVKGTIGSYVITSNNNIGYPIPAIPGTAYSNDNGATWTKVSSLPVGTTAFASATVGWSGGVNDSVYKWSSPLLPVELTSFTAQAQTQSVILNWITATELNNHGFEIQRKVAEGDFATVGFIKGEGTTTNQKEYSYVDKNLAEGKYFYRLKQLDFSGTYEYSKTIEVDIRALNSFTLEQNFPNPFNPSTKISWQSPVGSWQVLKVFDVLGNEVATLVNEYKPAGSYEVNFDGASLPSGVYLYKLQAGNFIETKKLMLLK